MDYEDQSQLPEAAEDSALSRVPLLHLHSSAGGPGGLRQEVGA